MNHYRLLEAELEESSTGEWVSAADADDLQAQLADARAEVEGLKEELSDAVERIAELEAEAS